MASDDEFTDAAGEDRWMFVRVVAAHEIPNLVGGLASWAVRVDGDVVALVEGLTTDLTPRVTCVECDPGEVAAISPEAL
ncbi:hypothetical protein [Halorubrum ezzemoulense]|uniref:hypothetical protein n=1 Tax=Halorubrum ezzemoulense TaxID=337243 RepID=UPI00232BD463|nr:hypothetical protein [Halorubrum ezzemoulense]MDB9235533.1 hypothetical protein [Halorubrum ezzemoulense]